MLMEIVHQDKSEKKKEKENLWDIIIFKNIFVLIPLPRANKKF